MRPGFIVVVLLLFFMILIGAPVTPAFADSDNNDSAPSDSIKQWKDKNLKKSALAWTGSAIGDVIYFPFWLTFSILKEGVTIVEKTKIVEKIDDLLTKDDGTRKLEPIISPSRGIGGRLILKRHGDDLARLNLAASGLHEGRSLEELELADVPLAGRALMMNLYGFYARMPEEPFFGYGPHSSYEMGSEFGIERFGGELGLASEVLQHVELEGFGGYQSTRSFREEEEDDGNTGDDFPDNPLWSITPLNTYPGGDERVELMFVGAGFSIDKRNHLGIPTKGYQFTLTSSLFTEVEEENFGFLKTYVDFRKYIHLFYGRTLIVRMAGEFTDPFDDRMIPFYNLSEIGETNTVRGFKRGRFRDNDAVYGTLEYRVPIRDVWQESGYDFHVFADGGQVASDIFQDFTWKNSQAGFGFGVRTWNLEKEALRVDFGFCRDGFRIYLVLNAI